MTSRLNPMTKETSLILHPCCKLLPLPHYSIKVGNQKPIISMLYTFFIFYLHADDNNKQFNLQQNRGCWTWKAEPNGKRGTTRKGSPKKQWCKITSHWWRRCRANTLSRVQQTFKLFGGTPTTSDHKWNYVMLHNILILNKCILFSKPSADVRRHAIFRQMLSYLAEVIKLYH